MARAKTISSGAKLRPLRIADINPERRFRDFGTACNPRIVAFVEMIVTRPLTA